MHHDFHIIIIEAYLGCNLNHQSSAQKQIINDNKKAAHMVAIGTISVVAILIYDVRNFQKCPHY